MNEREAKLIMMIRDNPKAMEIAMDLLINLVARTCPGAIIESGGQHL